MNFNEEFKERLLSTMRITIGAVADYIKKPEFNLYSEDQKDLIFQSILEGWGSIMSPEIEKVWINEIYVNIYKEFVENEKVKRGFSKLLEDLEKLGD